MLINRRTCDAQQEDSGHFSVLHESICIGNTLSLQWSDHASKLSVVVTITINEGTFHRCYRPGPARDLVKVSALPASLCRQALLDAHDFPITGHKGKAKSLDRLREYIRKGKWVGNVDSQCREFTKYQELNPLHQKRSCDQHSSRQAENCCSDHSWSPYFS